MFTNYHSPIGVLRIESGDGVCLDAVRFLQNEESPTPESSESHPLLHEVQRQLDAYFAGTLKMFDLPLCMDATPFTLKVWCALQTIPYAETLSYAGVAERIGHRGAHRAVGNANGKNPFVIIVPCHRVIAAQGKLGGYSAGLERKVWLLQHEMGKVIK
ncbi:MAG: methylated-DNA--[protein]-cysteine S-methyltransferase [Prevotellaceae bacterium]|jgi:methylated-DNA-[protein]-cysteine S-methyltransferase|nr:methylated-DNA--[protein]-cysteine S-methyltransferase [Prevotellaceae bacterium]